MSKDKGYIKIAREVFDTDIWNEPRKFSKFEAWTDIVRRTWYRDASKLTKKGEVLISLRKSAKKWDWSKDAVRRFIAQLLEAGMIAKTDKQGVYMVCDTARDTLRDTKRDTFCDTKEAENQSGYDKTCDTKRDTKRDSKRDTTRDTTPIIGEEYIKGKNACACAGPSVAPPAPATLPDGTPLPYGMTLRQWERFRSWAEKNVPTLMEVGITPTDYAIMRGKALSDVKKIATILLAMEKAGRPHRVRDEYIRRVERWREDKFNGLYG